MTKDNHGAVFFLLVLFLITAIYAPVNASTTCEFHENFQNEFGWYNYKTTERMIWLYGGSNRIVSLGDDNVLELKSQSERGYALGLNIFRQDIAPYYYVEFRIKINNDDGELKCIFYASSKDKRSDYSAGSENFGVIFKNGYIYVSKYDGEIHNKIAPYNKADWYKITMSIDFNNKKFDLYINDKYIGEYEFYEDGKSSWFVFRLVGDFDCYVDEIYIVSGDDFTDIKKSVSELKEVFGEEFEQSEYFDVDMTTSKSYYYQNEKMTIKTLIKNKSDKDRKAIYKILIDGNLFEEKEVSISANGQKIIETKIDCFDLSVGSHKIEAVVEYGAERYHSETQVQIKPIPYISVKILPSNTVVLGDEITLSIRSNVDGGTLEIIRVSDNAVVKEYPIQRGEKTITVDSKELGEGLYVVRTHWSGDNQTVDNRLDLTIVELTPIIKVVDITVTPEVCYQNEYFKVKVTYKNVGNADYKGFVNVSIGGIIKKQKVEIKAGEIYVADFGSYKLDPGIYLIKAGELYKYVKILPSPEIEINVPPSIKIGNKLEISGNTTLPDGTDISIKIEGQSISDMEVVKVKNGMYRAIFDTTSWLEGNYEIIVEAKNVKKISTIYAYKSDRPIDIELEIVPNVIYEQEQKEISVTVKATYISEKIATNILKITAKLNDEIVRQDEWNIEETDIKQFSIPSEKLVTGYNVISIDLDVAGTHITKKATITVKERPNIIIDEVDDDYVNAKLFVSKTECKIGEDVIVSLVVKNKLSSKEDLIVDMILDVPNMFSIYHASDVFSAVGNRLSGRMSIKPGDQRSVSVTVKATNLGSDVVKGQIEYMLKGYQNKREISIPITVKEKEQPVTTKEQQEQVITTQETQPTVTVTQLTTTTERKVPGFSSILAIISLLSLAIYKKVW